MDVIYDVDNWYRVGRGCALQFFATDDEVQEWLAGCLPEQFGPYSLVGADRVKQGRVYVEHPFEFSIHGLSQAMYEKDEIRWQYWIRSKVMTPELDFACERRVTWVFSCNGLVELQHGRTIRGMGRAASSLCLVDKVRNEDTGETRHYKDSLKVFNSLQRHIKKALCYSSIHSFKNGSEREDTRLQLMTEKAVEAYNNGFLFKNAPGRKLRR